MDLLAKIYFMAFASGGAFATLSWALAHAHHGHAHGHGHGHAHAHGGPRLAVRGPPKLAARAGTKLAHAPKAGGGGGPSVLLRVLAPLGNASALAALATIGGAAGYVSLKLGTGAASSVVIASTSGLIAAYAVGSLFGFLLRSSRLAAPLEAKGRLAHVLQRIGERGVGEVVLLHEGKRLALAARSADGKRIENETEVVILGVERGIATVARSSDVFAVERGSEEES